MTARPGTMRALGYRRYGGLDELAVLEVPQPTAARDEVLVEVHRAALNPKDALVRKGKFAWLSGRRFPKIVGLDYAGVVRESRSRHFRAGDRVFGMLNERTSTRGTAAEFVCVREDEVAPLPEETSFDEGAAIPLAGLTAWQALRDIARVCAGTRVWIHGAGGGVGTLAVQLAGALGARITTTTSALNRDLAASLGAHRTLDHRAPFWDELAGTVDVVFDVFGNLRFDDAVKALAGGCGVYVNTIPSGGRVVRDLVTRGRAVEERLVLVRSRRRDLDALAALLRERRLAAVVDSCHPIERARDAFAILEAKRARGKLVLAVR